MHSRTHGRTQRDGRSFKATAELSSRSRASHSLEHRHVKHREPPFCIVHDGRFICIRIHADFFFFALSLFTAIDEKRARTGGLLLERARSIHRTMYRRACRRNDKSRRRDGFGVHRHAEASIENGKPIGDSFLSRRTDPPPPSPPSSLRETSKLKDPPVYIDLISIPRN